MSALIRACVLIIVSIQMVAIIVSALLDTPFNLTSMIVKVGYTVHVTRNYLLYVAGFANHTRTEIQLIRSLTLWLHSTTIQTHQS